jgi:endonuclease/exonuclease/phosphatase family metal-dependent hydrolase
MPGYIRAFARNSLLTINVIAAVIFLLACLAPYLHPEQWWFISLLGLGFAFLFLVQIAFIVFWLLFKRKYALISFIALLIGWKSISVFIAVSFSPEFNYSKDKNTLRVVSWNVARFIEWRRNNNKGSQTRLKMMDLIKSQNADVLCLQEFMHVAKPGFYDNLQYMMKNLGYPYYSYSWDSDGELIWTGQVIFSRFPIIDSGIVRYPRPGMPESLLHADVLFNKDTIRFYTTHLQSVQFKKKDYQSIDAITKKRDSIIGNSRNIFSKLKRGIIFRSRQADIVKEITDISPYPFVLTGDFNDVPNSYTYFTVNGSNVQDAFLKKGFGIGRTYSYLSPTLRIDYIFTTKHFSILQFNRVVKDYSDHYMLVADMQLKK